MGRAGHASVLWAVTAFVVAAAAAFVAHKSAPPADAPACAQGRLDGYVQRGGTHPSGSRFSERPAHESPPSSADAAVAAVERLRGRSLPPDTHCVSYGLLTDDSIRTAGEGSALMYVNRPVWGVLVWGQRIPPAGPARELSDADYHDSIVYWLDAATGQWLFAETAS